MAVPRAKKKKDKPNKKAPKMYTESEVNIMLMQQAQRLEKEYKKRGLELITTGQELYKSIIYDYLADVKKFSQEQIESIDKFFARQVYFVSNKKLDFEKIQESLEKHGIDIDRVGKTTDEYIDKYRPIWDQED